MTVTIVTSAEEKTEGAKRDVWNSMDLEFRIFGGEDFRILPFLSIPFLAEILAFRIARFEILRLTRTEQLFINNVFKTLRFGFDFRKIIEYVSRKMNHKICI